MEKKMKLNRMLNKNHIHAVLLTNEYNRRYFAKYNIAEGMALISPEEQYLFTDSRYIEAARKNLPNYNVIMIDRNCGYYDCLNKILKDWGIDIVGYEEDDLSCCEFKCLEDVAKNLSITLVPVQSKINELRAVKTSDELDCIRKAQEITDKTFSDILKQIRTGITEKELKTELIYRLYKNGAEEPAFDPVVVSGPNTSMPHGIAGDRVLQEGDLITLDFGAKWNGYCSDMTRTVALGSATDTMKRVYDIVLRAQEAGLAATGAGKTGAEIDEAARSVIRAEGFEEFFGHGYGHGIGLEVHEQPNCSPSWKKPLPANCVCSAEPGIYLPGMFGVRIEDMVIVTENGCENLTKSPKTFIIL